MTSKLIAQGAEAKIILNTKDNLIVKDRVKKSYRIPELDNKIRKSRTKKEIKLLTKASQIINSPLPLSIKHQDINKITMPYIKGKKLSEHLDKFPLTKQKQICKQIGESIAKLHDSDIIHGDLTTSNMILVEPLQVNKTPNSKEVSSLTNSQQSDLTKSDAEPSISSKARLYFIDFGLGFISHKFEDKAVDIHLLKQALEAKHFKHYKELINHVLKGYKQSENFNKTITQLKKVEKRGRYKH